MRPTTHIVAIANQKGGVGKTTTAVNLGTALAQAGLTVLVIDLDPQGNASTGLDIARRERSPGCYQALIGGAAIRDCLRSTSIANLSLLPAETNLVGAEVELVNFSNREYRLRDAIAPLDQFTMIIIDCPPSLGLLTLNGLVAATSILVPLQCEFFALEGLSQLAQTVERVQRSFNPVVAIEGIVLTMYDRRNNLSELVAADARGFFGSRVYDTVIPRSIRVSEAPSHGKPVIVYDPKSSGALSYKRLGEEFAGRMKLRLATVAP